MACASTYVSRFFNFRKKSQMITKEQERRAAELAKQFKVLKSTQYDGWTRYTIDNVALAELIESVIAHQMNA